MYVGGGFLAPGELELAPPRRAAADEDRVIAFSEDRRHAGHAFAEPQLRLKTDDVVHLLVEHGFRQPEFRDLRAHHSAGGRILIVKNTGVAERQEIARDRERSPTRPD